MTKQEEDEQGFFEDNLEGWIAQLHAKKPRITIVIPDPPREDWYNIDECYYEPVRIEESPGEIREKARAQLKELIDNENYPIGQRTIAAQAIGFSNIESCQRYYKRQKRIRNAVVGTALVVCVPLLMWGCPEARDSGEHMRAIRNRQYISYPEAYLLNKEPMTPIEKWMGHHYGEKPKESKK